MLHLEIDIEGADYIALLDALSRIPALKSKSTQLGLYKFLLKGMTQQQCDEAVADLLNKSKFSVSQSIEKFAADQGVKLKVKQISGK